jgi:hypothetical protein
MQAVAPFSQFYSGVNTLLIFSRQHNTVEGPRDTALRTCLKVPARCCCHLCCAVGKIADAK